MYRHTQFGTVMVSILGAVILIMISLALLFQDLGLSIAIGVLLLVLYLFHSLTVEVTTDQLVVRFGPGLIRKRFLLDQISEVQIVRNRWYYGFGIRYTPHGWLYTVSGLDAIEIKLENNRQYRIGTDRPEELAAAIGQANPRIVTH